MDDKAYGDYRTSDTAFGQSERLRNFSSAIVELLVNEAKQALQAPDFAGLDYAIYLLLDAQKYDSLYPNARGIPSELSEATKKLKRGEDR